jgi:hypothetical protein
MKSKKRLDPTQDSTKVQHHTLRCDPCECAQSGHYGKVLGKLFGVDDCLLASLRSKGACIELPCQRYKSKRVLVHL